MNSLETMDVRQAHSYFAKDCFNLAWELMDKKDRTPIEEDKMIHLAHSSLYHWSRCADCTDQNLSIGYWQLSRAYALTGIGECALRFAKTSLSYAEQHGVARVFAGYAHEALARAYSLNADKEKALSHIQQANAIAEMLPEGDRDQLLSDLMDLS